MSHVIETVIFKLNPNVTEAEFLAAAQPTFDYLKTVNGYLKRELCATGDGQWIDIVHWRDMDSANVNGLTLCIGEIWTRP